MSSVPAGKRSWKCPECGGDVLLSMTQLDPIACEVCLVKMKGGSSTSGHPVADAVAGPVGIWQALPETTKMAIAAGALIIGFLVGMAVGFVVGKASVPREAGVQSSTSSHAGLPKIEEEEERPEAPGPGYKWVRGRERKDGTRGSGHWAKDPMFKGDDRSETKKKSK